MYIVIKTNSARIWDIGDTEYNLIKSFIDDLPAEQFAEIEEASPVRPPLFMVKPHRRTDERYSILGRIPIGYGNISY